MGSPRPRLIYRPSFHGLHSPYDFFRLEVSDTGLAVSGVTELPSRSDVTVTVATDGGHFPDPATFALAAEQAASRVNASVVTVETAHEPAAVAAAPARRVRSVEASRSNSRSMTCRRRKRGTRDWPGP